MKTEAQIKAELKIAKKDLAKTVKQFEKYDNHDDMEQIKILEAYIEAYEFVLS